jgi:ribose transport system permease protein
MPPNTADKLQGELPPSTENTGGFSFSKLRLPEEIGVIVALILLITFIGVLRPNFINPINLVRLLGNTSFWGILALGMVFLLAIGEVDLSIGWAFNFSAVITATLMVDFGIDPWIAVIGGILFGALLGFINGAITTLLNIPVIIVTLGTLSMYRGLALVVNNSRAIVPDGEHPFFDLMTTKLFNNQIPLIAIIFLIMAVTLHLVLHRTPFGYRVQAIGSNREAAHLVGIPIARVKMQTLIVMGALCGLSGAMFVGFRGAIDPTSGQDFMLTVIAAVIIGGTPLSGGSGSVIGAFLGVMIIAVINSGIIFFGVDAKWSTFVTGAVIIVAVALDTLVKRQRSRQAARIN